MNRRFAIPVLVACAFALSLCTSMASACPNCVDTLAADASTGVSGTSGSMAGGFGGSMAAGYYYSILFMLVMLFSVTGTVVYLIVRQAKADARVELPESA